MKKIIFTLLFFTAIACKKESTACETWNVTDYCVPLQSTVACSSPYTYELEVCGDDLRLAHNGQEKVRHQDDAAELMRSYNYQVR